MNFNNEQDIIDYFSKKGRMGYEDVFIETKYFNEVRSVKVYVRKQYKLITTKFFFFKNVREEEKLELGFEIISGKLKIFSKDITDNILSREWK